MKQTVHALGKTLRMQEGTQEHSAPTYLSKWRYPQLVKYRPLLAFITTNHKGSTHIVPRDAGREGALLG